ncbi:preprotein translocase subunit SecE [Candidatus Woesebacteria bacterium]|nr:preprotein translocase subunit SecE [Candidatus Woesebacteria bacterium]
MVSPAQYFREVMQELKKVSWPSRSQTQEKTIVVILSSLVIGLYLGLADYIFQQIVAMTITR